MKDIEIKLLNVDSGNQERAIFLASNCQKESGEVIVEGPNTGLHIIPTIRYKGHFIRITRDNPARGSAAVVQGKKQILLDPGMDLYLKPRETTIIDRLQGRCRILILTPK